MMIRGSQIRDSAPPVLQGACAQCALGKLCFPHALPAPFRSLLPLALEKRTRLARGESLFHAGEALAGLYAVKAGFLKTCMPLPDGQCKIVGFHAMGDVLGLEGLGKGTHSTEAVALNGCEVCLIPLAKLEKLLEHPVESVHVRKLMGREISRIEAQAAAVGTLSAKQLVASFLLDMSARWEERGYSKNEFVLFMSRKEIGNFLGLTFETVSRTLSYFHAKQWITVHGKNVLIRDMPALQVQTTHAT
ncbi:MAG: helix-turn-helix domain-containing protein [Betaproteobacteria bacterium]